MATRHVWALSAVWVLSCGQGEARLDVLLQTDYRPGLDFVEVRTELLDETSASSGVDEGTPYLSPTDVARFELPRATRRRVQVSLINDVGAVLQSSRIVSFRHDRDRQQLTRICAACADFACPLGQTCECGIEPVCVPDDCEGEGCVVDGCNVDADCGASGVDCVALVCREGACLRSPNDAVCEALQVCDVRAGCVTDPRGDGGVDAGSSDDGGFDAGLGDAVPPRPVAPLSTSTVTSQRPTLRWALAAGTDGAEVRLCRDRAMSAGCLPPITASGAQVRPTSALASGLWFWQLRGSEDGRLGVEVSPVWQFRVGTRSADGDRDTSWGTVADVNGDGFADVIVGAPFADLGGRTSVGTASVYLGSFTGLSSTPALVLEGVAVGDAFGFSVASAGDVDGDGFADVVVGALNASPGGRTIVGTASVYLGSAAGLSSTPALVLEGVAGGDAFGSSVASAGDVDGDGFADVIVGAPFADPGGRTSAGTASVYLGSAAGLSSTPAFVLEGVTATDLFGTVASAGDVDGDGFADVVVGALHADPGGRTNAGTASVYLGSSAGLSSTPALVLDGVTAGARFGESVASAGDVDGDGFADVIVGATLAAPGGRTNAGSASVYLGSATGLSSTAALVLEGVAMDAQFGMSVASAGDVDGDGFSDVIVGARFANPGGRTNAGTASVYLGSPAGLSSTPFPVLEGVAAGDEFGYSVGGAGDVDGDGVADVVVGAPRADPGGRSNAGAASVYLGSPAGLSSTPFPVLEGVAIDDQFGRPVASAG